LIDVGLLYLVGVVLVVVGVLVIVLSLFHRSDSGEKNADHRGHVKGGGVVIIGPVPIVFGSDKKTVKSLLVLSIVLTILVLTATIVWYLLMR
jgi:uncharacterized protein (TIGR00304 family)